MTAHGTTIIALLAALVAVQAHAAEPTVASPRSPFEIRNKLELLETRADETRIELANDRERLDSDEALLAEWQPLAENPGRLMAWIHSEEGQRSLRLQAEAAGNPGWWKVDPRDARTAIAHRVEAISAEKAKLVEQIGQLATALESSQIEMTRLRNALTLMESAGTLAALPAATGLSPLTR